MAQGTDRTCYNLLAPVPTNTSSRGSFSSGTTIPAHSPGRDTQVPMRQLLLLLTPFLRCAGKDGEDIKDEWHRNHYLAEYLPPLPFPLKPAAKPAVQDLLLGVNSNLRTLMLPITTVLQGAQHCGPCCKARSVLIFLPLLESSKLYLSLFTGQLL